jgi:nucleoid-associated protein YgaU
MVLFGIDGGIYDRAEVKAELEGRTVTDVVEEQLRAWIRAGEEDRAQTYVVRPGDTLVKIAIKLFGDPFKYALIAEYNGITDPGRFYVGQVLRIPSALT